MTESGCELSRRNGTFKLCSLAKSRTHDRCEIPSCWCTPSALLPFQFNNTSAHSGSRKLSDSIPPTAGLPYHYHTMKLTLFAAVLAAAATALAVPLQQPRPASSQEAQAQGMASPASSVSSAFTSISANSPTAQGAPGDLGLERRQYKQNYCLSYNYWGNWCRKWEPGYAPGQPGYEGY